MARSIIGFHYGAGGNKTGSGELIRALNKEGIPILLKGIDDAGLCFEGQQIGAEHGVENWLIYRVSTSGQEDGFHYDAPDYTLSPLEAAQRHWERTVARWPAELKKEVVWMEPINEPRAKASPADVQWGNLHPTDWLGKFMLEYATIANREGFKVCGPSFNSGEPEVFSRNDYELPGMLAYLRYCAENEDKAALSVHEYVWRRYRENQSWPQWYPQLFGRMEAAFAAADKHAIPRTFKVFVTEWGFAHRDAPRWQEARRHLDDYNRWAARFPQLKGVASWSLQGGWGNVDDDVASWLGPMKAYVVNTEFDEGPQPAPTHELFGSTVPGAVPDVSTEPPEESTGGATAAADDGAEAAGFASEPNVAEEDLRPNQTFRVTWTFRNSGTTTWDGTYRFAYTDTPHAATAGLPRAHFTPETSYAITEIGAPAAVAPGETVSLTLSMTAPAGSGNFGSNWRLVGPAGAPFGPTRWMGGKVAPAREDSDQHDVAFIDFENSVPNFEQMAPGQRFTGTWTVRNGGSAPWTGDFRLVFVDAPQAATAGRIVAQLSDKAAYTLREVAGVEQVEPGEAVTIPFSCRAPGETGRYAFHWQMQTPDGAPFGGVRWMVIGVKRRAETPGPAPSSVRFGMNININDGHELDAERLSGLSWVRFVFWASRRRKSPQQAYDDHYHNIIQAYAARGIRSLLILHQDTYWGNGPWDNGGYRQYAREFAAACAEVARAARTFGDMVAYQIFNEVDSGYGNDADNPNKSAIGIPPADYALILDAAVRAIKSEDPDATVVMSGMKTGPRNAINYIEDVRAALGGDLPVADIAYHPYGRYVQFDPFYEKRFGTLMDAMDLFRRSPGDYRLWITEIGIAEDNPLGPEHYPAIARYMREIINEVAANQADLVPVLVWFAWSDIMREAGIVTRSGEMKAHIGDVYREMIRLGGGP